MRLAPSGHVAAFTGRWLALSDQSRAVCLVLLGGLGFSIMAAMAKSLGEHLDSFQIAFFRALVGFLVLLPMVMKAGAHSLRTSVPHLHAVRVLAGTCAMMCGFYALTHLPLATATALTFTKPLFMIFVAIILLGETVRWRRWLATIVGFAGVVIMVRPDQATIDPAMIVALAQALFVAVAVASVKLIPSQESERTILFFFAVFSTVITAIPAALFWQWPTLEQLVLLLLMGAIGLASQAVTVRGFRKGEATVLSPLEYTKLIFATIVGFAFFAERPSIDLFIGAVVVLASTFYIVRREAALGKKREVPLSAQSQRL
ncbi:MAG: DMT family transporter [Pseudomonadota bacterium]